MLADLFMDRLRASGFNNFQDVRGLLPKNPQGFPQNKRPASYIKRITDHYDAVDAPDAYNALDRIMSEAWYHIRKDWGGGDRGYSLMYHLVCDRTGKLWITRDFEDMTWHCGSPNLTSLAYKQDGGENQNPTKEQADTYQAVHEVLCYHMPEFPAGQANVYGHLEMAQFGGTATRCPGNFLTLTQSYRSSRNVGSYRFPAITQQAPPPAMPTPPPAPVQVPVDTITPPPVVQSAAQAPVPTKKTVRVRKEWDGLRIRRTAGGADVIGIIYRNGGKYAAQFDVTLDRVQVGANVWLKRTEDNFFVAEAGVEYL